MLSPVMIVEFNHIYIISNLARGSRHIVVAWLRTVSRSESLIESALDWARRTEGIYIFSGEKRIDQEWNNT